MNWVGAGSEWYEWYFDLGSDNNLVIRAGGRPQWNVPVALGSFNVVPGDGMVTLDWQTFSEMNNACWIIKRGDQEIARLEGQGSKETPTDYIYVDRGLTNGLMYSYILEAWNYAGAVEVFGPVTATPVAICDVPDEFVLSQNYPNPFNPHTEIRYQIPKDGHVTLKIFNTMGQEVRTLVDIVQRAGEYEVIWEGRDNEDREVASSVYFCRLKAGEFSKTTKMVLLK
jgi:hypothetical protein